jgi:hypothetical protein
MKTDVRVGKKIYHLTVRAWRLLWNLLIKCSKYILMQNSNSKDAKQGQATIAANPLLAAVREMCKEHNPERLSFLAHQDYCRENYERGDEQKQCPKCGYWLFDWEM